MRKLALIVTFILSSGALLAQIDSVKKKAGVFLIRDEFIQKGKAGPFTLSIEKTTLAHTPVVIERLRIDNGVAHGYINLQDLSMVIVEMRYMKSQVDSSLNLTNPQMKLYASESIDITVRWNRTAGKWDYFIYLAGQKVEISSEIYLALLNAFSEIDAEKK